MRRSLLPLLECPFCGTPLRLVGESIDVEGDAVRNGVLGCECCAFPIVDGIPLIRADALARDVLRSLETGDAAAALGLALGLEGARLEAFEALQRGARPPSYMDLVRILSGDDEGTYFAYRFSDPTFVVSEAVTRALAPEVAGLAKPALDVAGGSGHLTRVLSSIARAAGAPAPVLADVAPWKLWLARIVVPDGSVVCCDANLPLPFARRAFSMTVCCDAFHYVWHRRELANEMARATEPEGCVVVTHAHNALVWNPSVGMPLSAQAYLHLFEPRARRIFGDDRLRDGIVSRGAVELEADLRPEEVASDASFTLISGNPRLFRRYPVSTPVAPAGGLSINPLYQQERGDGLVTLTLTFPSGDYEAEFGAARAYLPDRVTVEPGDLQDLESLGARRPDLIARRVLLDLPVGYL